LVIFELINGVFVWDNVGGKTLKMNV